MRAVLAVALVALVGLVASADARDEKGRSVRAETFKAIGPKHCGRYDRLHDWATKQFGRKTVGRDVCRYGMPRRGRDRPPTKAEFADTMATLRRWRHPPAPPQPVASTSYSVPSTGGGGGCTGMSAESGSAGYGAYNPDGGYIGCYQIAPGHYAPGGSCAGLGTDPAGQDACAGIICKTEGPGAWTNPQGQNPCGKL